jgi:D-alanyl-D-alanine carboxypeptidase
MKMTRRNVTLGMMALTAGGPSWAQPVPTVRYLENADGVTVTAQAASADTGFAIASVGKTMTAVALLRRVQAGELRLDVPAADWIAPEIAQSFGGLNTVTLRHILTMTSGLPDYYTDDYLADVLHDPSRQTAETALSYAFEEDRLFAPGTDFDYSNTNYVLLGLILETVTGQSYAVAMQTEVFGPAAMTDSFVFGSRSIPPSFAQAPAHVRAYYQSAGFGDGGVIATAPDVARFYRALFLDQTLLSPAMLAEMTSDPTGAGYGMGIELDGSIVGHSGGDLGFSSDVRLHLPTGTLAVMLVAAENADTGWTDDQMPD